MTLHNDQVLIRPEIDADIAAIHAVHARAFGQEDEAALVDQYLHKYYLSHLEQEVFLLEDSRERTIILKRYGLCGNKPHTQKEVAAMMGISRSYVSRIEKKALEKLRNSYEEYM